MKHCQWFFVLGLLAASPAGAQVFMQATLEDASAVLHVGLVETRWMPTGVAGFDIYRVDAWHPDAGTLVTPSVLPRQNGTYEIVDSGIQNDHLYFYELRSVDAMRQSITVDWGAYLSVGRALVAEATVVHEGCDAYLKSCPGAPFQNGDPVRGVAPSMVGDGQYYRMYGRIVGPSTPMSADVTTYVDEVVPTECSTLIAVEPSTWGHVKTLFR